MSPAYSKLEEYRLCKHPTLGAILCGISIPFILYLVSLSKQAYSSAPPETNDIRKTSSGLENVSKFIVTSQPATRTEE